MANNNVTLEEQIVISANEAIKAIDSIKKSVKGLKTETGSAGSVIKDAFSLGTLVKGGKKLLGFLTQANKDAMDLVETANLFEVSFGKGIDGLNKYYEKAIKFQNQLSEALGTNINESMNFQALFNSMGTSMGLDREVAYKISENFTKLGYDLASLYNTETDKAMQKLQSGLSGSSTRPLRSFGIDITQSTLASTLTDLGLDKTISKLNQAEKMVLRYIAVLRQSTVAHGDFARTLESPANQLRIFQAQCLAFRQNIGSLWQGIYAKWMPYINGILMAINALIRVIGSLFGIKFGTSMQSASKSLKAGASGAGGIASGLKDASGSAKDLKEQLDLMPWDEIHNIDLGKDKSSSSGGSGGGAGGGGGGMDVDPALLNAMGEYDNMMDKVRNKATDIRDRIMEWLGFTKKINPFTNEISWEYTGMSESARKILGLLKAIVAVGIASKIVKFAGKLMTLKDVLAGTVKPTTAFQRGLVGIAGGLKHAFIETVAWGQNGIMTFKQTYEATGKVSKSLVAMGKDLWALVPVAVKATAGVAGLGVSTYTTFKAMREISDESQRTAGSFVKLGAGMAGAVASGAVLGSVVMPGVGTAVGAVAGGVVGLTGALFGWQDAGQKLQASAKESKKSIDEYIESIHAERQAVQDSVDSQLAYVGYVENLANELDTLVDAEGRVKAGMEDRVKFILTQLNSAMGTEYEIIDGQVKGYGELKGSIEDVIQKKRDEIILNAKEQVYTDAIMKRTELQRKLYDEQVKLNDAHKKQHEILTQINELDPNNFFDAQKILALANEYNHLADGAKTTQENINTLTQQIGEDNELIINYENALEAIISGNTEKEAEAINNLTTTCADRTSEIGRSVAESIGTQISSYEALVAKRGELSDEEYRIQSEGHEKQLDELAQTLVGITTTTNANEPGIVEAWRRIANNSEQRYNDYISKLDPETRTAVENALGTLDSKRGDAKTAGENVAGSTIEGAEARVNDRENGIAKIAKFIIDGLTLGVASTGPLGMLLNAGRTMMDALFKGAKERADIGSPSKEMYKFGDFLVQGLANGVKENAGIAVSAMKDAMGKTLNEANKLATGVSINPSEYSVDVNKFIDYGSVSGAVSSQIDVTDNISDRVYQAVMDGLQASTINVDIEAKTEEGILLKKVQNQARQYRMQTGKAPFPTM